MTEEVVPDTIKERLEDLICRLERDYPIGEQDTIILARIMYDAIQNLSDQIELLRVK